MQQAESLFQFDFSPPVYENLIVSLVNVCPFLRSTWLCSVHKLYIRSLYASRHYAVVIALYSRSFGHRNIVLEETYVILAKFAPHGSENRKIFGSDPD